MLWNRTRICLTIHRQCFNSDFSILWNLHLIWLIFYQSNNILLYRVFYSWHWIQTPVRFRIGLSFFACGSIEGKRRREKSKDWVLSSYGPLCLQVLLTLSYDWVIDPFWRVFQMSFQYSQIQNFPSHHPPSLWNQAKSLSVYRAKNWSWIKGKH